MGLRDWLHKAFNTNLFYGWREGREPYPAWADQFHTQRSPSVVKLIDEYKLTAHACANLNAHAVASAPYRLYATAGAGLSEPKCAHRGVSRSRKKWLAAQGPISRKMASADDIVEITDPNHPALRLLENPNIELDGFSLIEYTQLYQEISGTSYWYTGDKDEWGTPTDIWIIPSQYVRMVRGEQGPLYYMYGLDREQIPISDVIRFQFPNLRDPYGDLGWSPLRAAWEVVNIDAKDNAWAQALADNNARPDILVALKDAVGPDERKAFEKSMQKKFRRGGAGGIATIDGTSIDLKMLTYNSKDLEMLARKAANKVTIANAFGVPIAMLESKNVNRANADAAYYAHAKLAVAPRLTRLFKRLNHRYCTLFDSRLFLWFDDPVPDDNLVKSQVRAANLSSGVTTINEERADDERPAASWGETPWVPNTLTQVPGGLIQDGHLPGGDPNEDEADEADAKVSSDTVLEGPQIMAATQIVEAVSGGGIPRDSGVGQLQVLFNMTSEQAEQVMGSAGTGTTTRPDDNGEPDPIPPGQPGGPPIPPATSPGEQPEDQKPKPPKDDQQANEQPISEPGKAVAVLADFWMGKMLRAKAMRELWLCGYHMGDAYNATEPLRIADDSHREKAAAVHDPLWHTKASVHAHGRVLPTGEAIAALMRRFFVQQKTFVLTRLKAVYRPATKDRQWYEGIPLDLSDWTDEMAKEAAPLIALYWEQGAKDLAVRLGLSADPGLWNVSNPRVRDAMQRAAFDFCDATNQTTSRQLSEALQQLRTELADGILGEQNTGRELTRRVAGIFDQAESYRAERIALTESSRALHMGQVEAAKESGLVSGIKWLASDNACPICQAIAAENPDGVPLGHSFNSKDSGGAYDDIPYPPAHPYCQCTITEILAPDVDPAGAGDRPTEGDDQ